MRRFVFLVVAGIFLLLPHTLYAQQGATWVVSWVASAHGPYPVGNPSAQPDQRFAFPSAQTGANDQTFRLIVRPDIWGRQARLFVPERHVILRSERWPGHFLARTEGN